VNAWYRFGPFQLDPRTQQLQRGEQRLELSTRAIQVLTLLVENAGTVVRRAELLDRIWAELEVHETVLTRAITEIRRVLDDRRRDAEYIETVHGQGFRFVAPVEVAGAPSDANVPSPELSFVGRDAALAELSAAAAAAAAGQARAVVISGPAGIGKSRVMQELARRLRTEPYRILAAQAGAAAQHPGFWLWAQLCESLAAGSSSAELRSALAWAAPDIVPIAPALRRHIEPGEAPAILDPGLARTRLFTGMASFFSHLSETAPLVLLLDDLDRAGDDSLALLEAVTTAMRDRRLLVVATYRDDAVTSASFQGLLDAWRGARVLIEIVLPALSEAEAQALLVASGAALPAAQWQQILDDSGGHPLFLLELAAALRQRESVAPPQELPIPERVRQMIGERIAAMSSAARSLLAATAVTGGDLDNRLGRKLAGLEREQLAAALAELLAAGLLVEVPDAADRLRFRHELVREAVLRELAPPARSALHLAAAEIFEEQSAGSEAELARLAYHYAQAGEAGGGKALSYALGAAEEALARFSNESARDRLMSALELANRFAAADDPRWGRLFENIAELRVRMGDFDEAERIAERLLAMAEAQQRTEWLAAAALALGRCYVPFRPKLGERAIVALERALDAVGDRPSPLRALLAARLAVALLSRAGADARRIELAREAVAYARASTDFAERVRLLYESVIAFWDVDHAAERDQIAAELGNCAGIGRRPELAIAAYGWQMIGHLSRGELQAAEAVLRAGAEEPHLQNTARRRYHLRFEIQIAIARGELEHADALLARLSALPDHPDRVSGPMEVLFAQLMLKRERGQLEGVDLMMRALAGQLPIFPLRWALPFVLVEMNRLDEARAELEILRANDFTDLPPRNEVFGWLAAVTVLGYSAARLGDRRLAQRLYPLLLPYEGQWAVLHFGFALIGSVGRALGGLAAVLGDDQAATGHYRRAIEQCTRERAAPELARLRNPAPFPKGGSAAGAD